MRTYGQYCPIARGAEIFAERWTPLIVRNLYLGCGSFSEILEGAPPLLILRGAETRPPRMIEAWLGDEAVRLDLAPPVEGAIVLALDPAVAEAYLGGQRSDAARAGA